MVSGVDIRANANVDGLPHGLMMQIQPEDPAFVIVDPQAGCYCIPRARTRARLEGKRQTNAPEKGAVTGTRLTTVLHSAVIDSKRHAGISSAGGK